MGMKWRLKYSFCILLYRITLHHCTTVISQLQYVQYSTRFKDNVFCFKKVLLQPAYSTVFLHTLYFISLEESGEVVLNDFYSNGPMAIVQYYKH